MIGSFLNVCIYRIPKKIKFISGRSKCTTCNRELGFIDLIPVISYLQTRGKCRYCGEKISLQYPVIEIINAVLYLFSYIYYGNFNVNFFISCILISVLIVVSVIDIQTMEIFDRFHFIIFTIGIIYVIYNKSNTVDHLVGALAISIPMLILSLLFNGFGGGDIKLMFASGFLLSWQPIIIAIMIACILGSVYGIIFRLNGKSQIPFGPFLSVGIITSYFYGEKIWNFYFNSSYLVQLV